MSQLLPFLIIAGALAAVMGFFTWLASVVRRRGLAGAGIREAMASFEEAYKVTSHDSYYEIQAQARAQSPLAAPGDPWRGAHRSGPRRPRGVRRRRITRSR
ncbi:hypothetical protein [Streptomyces sp. NPDC056948]|uniref:hypothetical protein n=1 Tax=Streptomyces sp. NPDC056948 TaxID=3345975 RepID=UPI0036387D90